MHLCGQPFPIFQSVFIRVHPWFSSQYDAVNLRQTQTAELISASAWCIVPPWYILMPLIVRTTMSDQIYINRELQAVNLRRLLQADGFRFIDEHTPWFPYTSGQIGPYYVQSVNIEKDGEAYATAIESLVKLIRDWGIEFDVIAGGETRDWDFSNPCAVAMRKPHVKIYKDGRMLGADLNGQRVLHVVDLNNEGSSVRDYWQPLVARRGGKIVGVASFVDRMEEGLNVMRELKLPLASVVPLDQAAWQIALEDGYVSKETHAALLARRQDPLAWALDRLKRYPEPLHRMLQGAQTRSRALKIIAFYKQYQPELERQAK